MKKKAVPAGSEDEKHRKTILSMACIAAIKPDLRSEEVCNIVNKAFIAEHPDCYASLHVDEDALTDVVDKGEAKKVSEYMASLAATQALKEVVMATREAEVGKFFKSSAPPKYNASDKKLPRWLPEKDEDKTRAIEKWLHSYAPSNVKIVCDDYNGRWRVIAPTLEMRSLSWTKRGHQRTALEVLHQAWLYEQDWSGRKCPFSLDELEKKYNED
jgi:hypothetical protein